MAPPLLAVLQENIVSSASEMLTVQPHGADAGFGRISEYTKEFRKGRQPPQIDENYP